MNRNLLFVVIGLFAITCFIPHGAFAKQLTVRDIQGAYQDAMDTFGFENLSTSGSDTFTSTGDEFIVFKNNTTSDSQVRIVSVADDLGRKQDNVDTVPANNQVIVGPMQRQGWADSSGIISVKAEDAIATAGDIEVAIIREIND